MKQEQYPAKEILEFVQVCIETDAKQTASELARYVAFVYCSPCELFGLWFRSFLYYIKSSRKT